MTSPCVKICKLDGNRCTGCGRTLDEIARWSTMGDAERAAIARRVQPAAAPASRTPS